MTEPLVRDRRGLDSWPLPAVACGALLLGAFFGYASLAAGPLGMGCLVAAGALCAASERRSLLLSPFLIGAGMAGAWLLLPALTNSDPAVSYPLETGLIPFVLYVMLALAGVAPSAGSLVRRRLPHL